MWMTKPADYVGDVVFDIKFTLRHHRRGHHLLFQKVLRRDGPGLGRGGRGHHVGKRFTALVCFVWAAVIVTGRLTAYLGTLYSGGGS